MQLCETLVLILYYSEDSKSKYHETYTSERNL